MLLTSQSDERLVALVRAGHERAFTAIVERYRPELYVLARRLSSNGNSEDVLQQAFLGAFAALRAGADVKHLRGWLYRIVRNAAARSRTPVYTPLDGATASPEVVEDIVQQRALALDALAELGRLPSRQRRAIVGTVLDGRSRAEIASSMGLSEGAVRQLTHRARARLRSVATAVTPWSLAQWIAGGPSGGGNSVEVVASAGAGAASTGGFLGVKLGILLASGAIATGVAAVDIHGLRHPAASSPTARAAAPAGHPQPVRRGVRAVESATVAPEAGAPGVMTSAAVSRAAVTPEDVSPAVMRAGAPRSAAVIYVGTSRRSRSASNVIPVRRPAAPGGAGTRTGEQSQYPDGGGMHGGHTDAGAMGGGGTDTVVRDAGARGRGDGGGSGGGGGATGRLDGGGDQSGGGSDRSGSGTYAGGDGRSRGDGGGGAGAGSRSGSGSGGGGGSRDDSGELVPELATGASGNSAPGDNGSGR